MSKNWGEEKIQIRSACVWQKHELGREKRRGRRDSTLPVRRVHCRCPPIYPPLSHPEATIPVEPFSGWWSCRDGVVFLKKEPTNLGRARRQYLAQITNVRMQRSGPAGWLNSGEERWRDGEEEERRTYYSSQIDCVNCFLGKQPSVGVKEAESAQQIMPVCD
jgi:hypothetical protein